VPLVVNTPGWVKGMGLSMLADLVQAVRPATVLNLQSGNARKDLPAGPFWAVAGASLAVRRRVSCLRRLSRSSGRCVQAEAMRLLPAEMCLANLLRSHADSA
jgi:polynucleotide 5'-kinase involved in rRNA processing